MRIWTEKPIISLMLSFFDAGVSSQFGCPQNWPDIVIGSFLFAFFGVFFFIGAIRYEMTYDKIATWWKWCFAPLGLALLLGVQRISFLRDFGYLQTVTTKKLMWSHYFGVVVPILCVASIILYKKLKQRNEQRRVY